MKKIIIICFALLISGATFAQKGKVQDAYLAYQNYTQYGFNQKDLMKAYEAIEAAAVHEESKGMSKTWMYRGLIFAQLSNFEDSLDIAKGATDKAYESFVKVVELEKVDKKKSKTDEALQQLCIMQSSLYNKGSQLFQSKNYKAAYGNFNKSLEIGKMEACKALNKDYVAGADTSTLYAAGLSAFNADMNKEAAAMMEELVNLNFKESSIYTILYEVYKKQGAADKAKDILAKGRKLFPNDKSLIINEVNASLGGDNKEDAIKVMEEAIKVDPQNATLQFALGTAYDAAKNYTKAAAAYTQAIAIDPKYFDAYYNLGTVYFNQAAEKTQEMNKKDAEGKLSDAEYESSKKTVNDFFSQALPHFEKALTLQANDCNTMQALSQIYARISAMDKIAPLKEKIDANCK
ncbi:MAG: tetratricopeptide repeat protein [Sphingobacteriales bacterium]|nr:tetratricopeptide repeat protein [Sphingobacteriales bacterium]